MKTLPRLFAVVLAVSATALVVAEVQPAAAGTASSSAAPSMAGDYIGTWRNDTEGGKLRLSLKQSGARWTAEASFTFHESEIPCKVTTLKVEGAKIEIVLDWVIEESPGKSQLTGELSGAKIEGTYQSETPDTASSGTWTVTRT